MYVEKNPHDVNELLKANNGFQEKSGNFIWSKCSVLGLSQVYQSPYYSDPVTPQGLSKMRSLLDEGRPLITHIDFDPSDNDDDQHWLIVYGYNDNDVFYAHDPWSDTDITLEVYGGVKRCVYEWRAYDKTLQKDLQIDLQKELDDCRVERDRNWNWYTNITDLLNVGTNNDIVVAEVKKLVGLEDRFIQKERETEELKREVADAKQQNESLSTRITEAEKAIVEIEGDYKNKLQEVKEELQTVKDINTTLSDQLQKLENQKPLKEYTFWEWLNARWR
jgi:hypothetical protein